MRPLYVTGDTHLASERTAGVTPSSALQLRDDLLKNYAELLARVTDGDLLLNGDIFDKGTVAMRDLYLAFEITRDWLAENKSAKLWLSRGNHDAPKSSLVFSSFDLFGSLLESAFPVQVRMIKEPTDIGNSRYVIPHMQNQALFDLALERVSECEYIFLHCNFDNGFCVESDHSLGISKEQALALPAKHLIVSHEHAHRIELQGKAVMIGNPFPASVSDALHNDTKHMLKITDGGMEFIETWRAEGDFCEMDWRELEDNGARFIRAVGSAEADEAALVMTAISRFRAESSALIITNAVKVAGINDAEQLELSHEEITSFSVRDALRELLTEEENEKIDQLGEPT